MYHNVDVKVCDSGCSGRWDGRSREAKLIVVVSRHASSSAVNSSMTKKHQISVLSRLPLRLGAKSTLSTHALLALPVSMF